MSLPARSLAIVLASFLITACSEDEATDIDIGPTGPPSIAFEDPKSETGDAVCVSIGTDASARVPILVKTDELLLRPPGACGVYAQCGHLRLLADGVLNNEGATTVIELLIHKLASPYHDGSFHEGTQNADVLSVVVEVVDEEDEVINDHDGDPLRDEIELLTVVSCDDLSTND